MVLYRRVYFEALVADLVRLSDSLSRPRDYCWVLILLGNAKGHCESVPAWEWYRMIGTLRRPGDVQEAGIQ